MTNDGQHSSRVLRTILFGLGEVSIYPPMHMYSWRWNCLVIISGTVGVVDRKRIIITLWCNERKEDKLGK